MNCVVTNSLITAFKNTFIMVLWLCILFVCLSLMQVNTKTGMMNWQKTPTWTVSLFVNYIRLLYILLHWVLNTSIMCISVYIDLNFNSIPFKKGLFINAGWQSSLIPISSHFWLFCICVNCHFSTCVFMDVPWRWSLYHDWNVSE